MDSIQYKIECDRPEFVVFTFDRYVGLIWKTSTTAEGVYETMYAFNRVLAEKGTGLFVVVVVPKNLDKPDTEAMIAIRQFLKDVAPDIKASIVIHMDTGWRVSIVRAVTSTLAWMAQIPFQHKGFEGITPATFWLRDMFGEDPKLFYDVMRAAIEKYAKDLPGIDESTQEAG